MTKFIVFILALIAITCGANTTFQWLFQGNVTLQAASTGEADATVTGLFLDNVPSYTLPATQTGYLSGHGTISGAGSIQ